MTDWHPITDAHLRRENERLQTELSRVQDGYNRLAADNEALSDALHEFTEAARGVLERHEGNMNLDMARLEELVARYDTKETA